MCDALAARAAAPFPPQARCGAQGSFNDLQLLLVLNLTIVTVGGLIKHYVVDPAANAKNLTLDQDWYRARPSPPFSGPLCCHIANESNCIQSVRLLAKLTWKRWDGSLR